MSSASIEADAIRPTDRRALIGWIACFAFVTAMHITAVLQWQHTPVAVEVSSPPAIVAEISLAAEPAAVPAKAQQLPPPPTPQQPVVTPTPIQPPPLADLMATLHLARPVKRKINRPIVHRQLVQQKQRQTQPTEAATQAPAATAPSVPHESAPSAAQGNAKPDWENQVLGRIARFKHYPVDAERRGWQGTPILHFIVRRDGSVSSISISKSSGHDSLDDAAEESLRHASPLPAPPASVTSDTITLDVPLNFTLSNR